MSQKTLNLCLERYNFVKFGETTKSTHTVLCTNNAYSVNSDKYRLTPTAIASKHGEGYVFTLNYDFDRPLFTIVQKSYSIDGTSGKIVFEGIDPISKDGSKYLRRVEVSPVKLSDGSYLLEVTKDEYLRIGTTGAALGDEGLESLNEKIVTMGGIEKSVETVGGKQVLKLDASGSGGAKEIVYFDVDPSDPPSGLYAAITEALSKNKLPAIKIDDALYLYTATGTDKYVFVGGFMKESVGYTEIEVSDDDSVTSKSVDDKVYNMYILSQDDPASPGETPSDEDQWVCDADKHVITKDELVAAHADCRYFILNNAVEPDSNSRKYFASVTVISNSYIRLRFYMMQYDAQGVAEFYQKTVVNDSEGRLYILSSYSATLAGTMQAVLVSEPQSFDSTQKAQGRDNIGAASASDVAALQSQVSSLSDVSAYSAKGEATVAQLNAGPSGIQAGWAYQLTDSGTLTDGSLAVVAGDSVAWDGTKWFPLVKSDYYATKTYAQNVAASIAPEYDGTTGAVAGMPYVHGGKLYVAKEDYSGVWDESKFEEMSIEDLFAKKSLVNSIAIGLDSFVMDSHAKENEGTTTDVVVRVKIEKGKKYIVTNKGETNSSFKLLNNDKTTIVHNYGTISPGYSLAFTSEYDVDFIGGYNSSGDYKCVIKNGFDSYVLQTFDSISKEENNVDTEIKRTATSVLKNTLVAKTTVNGAVDVIDGSIVANTGSYAQEIDVTNTCVARFWTSSYSVYGFALLDGSNNLLFSKVTTDQEYVEIRIPSGATKLRICWRVAENNSQEITLYKFGDYSKYYEYAERIKDDYDVTNQNGDLSNVGVTNIDGTIDTSNTGAHYQELDLTDVSFIGFFTSSYVDNIRGWTIKDSSNNVIKYGRFLSGGNVFVVVPAGAKKLLTCWKNADTQVYHLYKKTSIALNARINSLSENAEYNADVKTAMGKVANYNNVAGKFLNIAFITDTHINRYDKDKVHINNFVNAAKSIIVDVAIHGGDVISSRNLTASEYIAELVDAEKDYDGIENFVQCYGNHENNYYLTSGEVTPAAIFAIGQNKLEGVTPEGNFEGYFYKDFDVAKVRLIVLNSHYDASELDPDTGYSVPNYGAAQLSWLENTALDAPAGYKVIIFAHSYDYGHNTTIATIISDFITNGGNFVAYVHGHDHVDSYSTTDGFNVVGVTWGANETAISKFGGCSIFTITDNALLETRIGSGSNRSFNFN